MTINDLLEYWAYWSSKREDGGLGYGVSRVNVMMAGGVVCGTGNRDLPYGIDSDSVAMAVNNYIAKLNPVAAAILKEEYLRCGDQAAKSKRVSAKCGVVVTLQNYRVTLHRAVKKMEGDPEIARLLKKIA